MTWGAFLVVVFGVAALGLLTLGLALFAWDEILDPDAGAHHDLYLIHNENDPDPSA